MLDTKLTLLKMGGGGIDVRFEGFTDEDYHITKVTDYLQRVYFLVGTYLGGSRFGFSVREYIGRDRLQDNRRRLFKDERQRHGQLSQPGNSWCNISDLYGMATERKHGKREHQFRNSRGAVYKKRLVLTPERGCCHA